MIKEFQKEYRWLSNFYPCSIEYDGVVYDSVEHAYQAAKTLDLEERKQFINIKACEAKRLGKKVKIREDWEKIKLSIMKDLVKKKFLSNQSLYLKLLDTKNEMIQEGNYWGDTFWGVDLRTGKGENNLGKIIIQIRKELRDERDQK